MVPYLVWETLLAKSKFEFILLKGIWPYLNHSVLAIGALPSRPEQLIRIPLIEEVFFNSRKVFLNARLKLALEFSNSEDKKLEISDALSPKVLCWWKLIFTVFGYNLVKSCSKYAPNSEDLKVKFLSFEEDSSKKGI